MTAQQRIGMRQFIYKVTCSMGVVEYSTVALNSTAALAELDRFFMHDPKFAVQTIDKLVKYRIKGQ